MLKDYENLYFTVDGSTIMNNGIIEEKKQNNLYKT